MKWTLLFLVLGGCELKADMVKACGEACKDHNGMKWVTAEHCECEKK